MKTPRQQFCDQKEIAQAAMDAIASTPVQRAMHAAFEQVAWTLGTDGLAHAKIAGIRAFMDALNAIGVPPDERKRPAVGFLDDPDELGGGNRKGASQ
jgi:hypothetical protein